MMPHHKPAATKSSSPDKPAVQEPEEKKSDEKNDNNNKNIIKKEESDKKNKDDDNETPIVGIRKEDLDEVPEASSPAPAPIKGGDEDVFTVSHIGRIEIKEKKAPVEQSPPPSAAAAAVEPRRSRSATRSQQKKVEQEYHDDTDQSSAPMDVIEKSPYEPEFNAEKGVKIFQEMKELLIENDGDDYRSVSAEATKIFGPTNAWCLVKANALIDKSGMVFSQEWTNGNIRGNLIGKIPNDLLLLCLVSNRFVRASEQLLQGVTRDLQVYDLVKEGVKDWGLEDEYPRICSTAKNFAFTSQKRNCLKCEIFIARAFSCQKAFLGKIKIDESLMNKIKSCLDIMESHLGAPGSTSSAKKRKKVVEPVVAPTPPADEQGAPAKRRRGRPPKKVKDQQEAAASQGVGEASDVTSQGGEGTPSPARVRRRSNGSGTVNGKKQSLQQLVQRFEIQYEEMGERYRDMGETLKALKSKIVENRDTMEQEIRDELLQEVQKTIMSGYPKKG